MPAVSTESGDDSASSLQPWTATNLRQQEEMMSWLILLLAGLMEIAWAVGLKYTQGFSRLWPSLLTMSAMVASVGLLGIAMKTLPVGTAYAAWTGIGVVGTVLFGALLLDEPLSAARLACVALILAGIVGLKLFG
jgi:quaternary ammonium compound-resistance protein SugE